MNKQEKPEESQVGVHMVWKRVGETPLECIGRFRQGHAAYADVPMTYAGRLDPAAEGVLLLLSGDALARKEDYLGLQKTYRFEVLWGVTSDTLDVLGVPTFGGDTPSEADVKQTLKTSTGLFEQRYPAFSSKPVLGKPLFQWAREGRLSEVEMPQHEVEIISTPLFVARRSVSAEDITAHVEKVITAVKGDFRQSEIQTAWRDVLREHHDQKFAIDTIEITVSSGFYIRQFVADLAARFGTSALAYSIVRTRVGEYAVALT